MKIISYLTKFFVLVGLALSQMNCADNKTVNKMILNKNWEFKATGDSIWLKASVPGSVHTNLLENKLIEDPYYRLNEHDVQWVDKKDWEYKTVFSLNRGLEKR